MRLTAALVAIVALAAPAPAVADSGGRGATRQVPPLAWVRRQDPTRTTHDVVFEAVRRKPSRVVVGQLGEPHLVTRKGGDEVLWYRCGHGTVRVWVKDGRVLGVGSAVSTNTLNLVYRRLSGK